MSDAGDKEAERHNASNGNETFEVLPIEKVKLECLPCSPSSAAHLHSPLACTSTSALTHLHLLRFAELVDGFLSFLYLLPDLSGVAAANTRFTAGFPSVVPSSRENQVNQTSLRSMSISAKTEYR